MKILATKYDPKAIEDRLYSFWEQKGYFKVKVDKTKKPFTIMMPPPNITGQLHMGHAIDNTMQDIIIRMKRMQGYSALWVPGTDHASIATEAKIVESMRKEGINKHDIGREEFLKRAWEWREKYGTRIVEQLKKMGSSCDWSRERFTMDEGLSKAVVKAFINLYEKGLIYRGEKIINWCPVCGTSISNAEVEYEEKEGALWYIRYPIENTDGYVTVATTRPETMIGDTAVAVNPDDDRYKHLVGKNVILPLVNKRIPVVADEYVEKDFGTGVVKITPAHDPNDFEVGLRHNLPIVNAMNDDATMNENAGKYSKLDRYEARKRIVEDLENAGLIDKIEKHMHNVGSCYRCDSIVEPKISTQWFVKMEPLAKPAVDVVNNGETEFIPSRFAKIYLNWMEDCHDWCISRQLWWGHRIPAYYCNDCSEIIVSEELPKACTKCQSTNVHQDEDTLDTWFSSALWPFSTLGWPDKTDDLAYFYPTDVLVTGYDIIFFWVARMIFSGVEYTGKTPFSKVLIHGLVRDELGRKMSKSLGNGVDPLDIISQYGTDALRFSLITGNSPGNDLRFSETKVEAGRNFANKIWNATRFVLMNFDESPDFSQIDRNNFENPEKWILTRLNHVIKEVTDNMEKFELGIALQKIYEFIWDEFCDWYIELVKPKLYDKQNPKRKEALYVLNYTLTNAMKLLHPFMPFISEEIYQSLADTDESIMISNWPIEQASNNYTTCATDMGVIMDAIKSIRNKRAELNIEVKVKSSILFVSEDEHTRKIIEEGEQYFIKLAFAKSIMIFENANDIPDNSISIILPGFKIFMPFKELVDIEDEMKRLEKEYDKALAELLRAKSKLENEAFVSKAPANLVDSEKQKLKKFEDLAQDIKKSLENLKCMS
ncbi:MAG TPA: valine--tRNA ligase [Clostridia bacterium]|nr:MAG: Valine--tRNA ligase [Firmicutes bacterium ADurb.Bin146]HOD93192.1 valine--tRNA ligase [Clostridia bacterium]HQM38921.1 valine--tRNA ligase [Clostridia bacterium]